MTNRAHKLIVTSGFLFVTFAAVDPKLQAYCAALVNLYWLWEV